MLIEMFNFNLKRFLKYHSQFDFYMKEKTLKMAAEYSEEHIYRFSYKNSYSDKEFQKFSGKYP